MYKTGYEWPDWMVPAATQGSIGEGGGSVNLWFRCDITQQGSGKEEGGGGI